MEYIRVGLSEVEYFPSLTNAFSPLFFGICQRVAAGECSSVSIDVDAPVAHALSCSVLSPCDST